MNRELKAIGAGFSCADVYEKLNQFYPAGNGADWAQDIYLVDFDGPQTRKVYAEILGE